VKRIRRTDPVLHFFKEAVTGALGSNLRQIVLFGSRARGDAKAGSDYDLLVVVDKVSPQTVDDLDDIAGKALVDHGVVVSAFPIAEEDRARRRYSPLLLNVAREGVAV
jgi:predicted nucleotidyltransferase